MKLQGVVRTVSLLAAWSLLSGFPAGAAQGADAVRLLVVMRATEQPNHIYVWGGKYQRLEVGRTFGEPSMGRSATSMLLSRLEYLNDTFKDTIASYDRDKPLAAAMAQAFAERGPLIEITPTTAVERYLKRGISMTLTDAPRTEGFHFVLVIHDDFVGLATLDSFDAENGIMTPAYDASYALYDVADGEIRGRGKVSSNGYLSQPYEKATKEPALFGYLWPYLCSLNATNIVDQLLRADHLHFMAARVGRGAELPAVAARLAEFERRLVWKLDPVGGWHEIRSTIVSRMLEPVNEQRKTLRMTFEAEFLIPELGQGVRGVDEFLPLYDRRRLRVAPKSTPLEPFTNIAAGEYRAWRYQGQAGETNLVLFRATDDSLMRVVTVSIADDFDKAYPKVRATIEKMLHDSVMNLSGT